MPDSTTHPATEWSMLHDKFYRRVSLYEMEWQDIDLENYDVIGAPFGGPIALIRAENRLQVVRDHTATTPAIMIFTASGQLLSKINLDTVRIVKLGWSSDERLVCLCANGIVRLYNLFGEMTQFTLSSEASEEGVIDGRIWGTGLVALLSNYRFVAITRFTDARARQLANPELSAPPSDWVVVPPSLSISRDVELYASVAIKRRPFSRMALSPNCKLMALFNKEGKVSVTSADFQRYLSEFQTESHHLTRCGVDSVVMASDDELTVIGPFGDCIVSNMGTTHLVTEIDGVRAISSKESYFIDKVPQASERLFRLGSTEPGALLLDAYDCSRYKENPKAQEHIRNLKDDLATAINDCIEAASFGMSFMDTYNADTFVDMCNYLRIPMTYPQFMHTVRIAEHLHLPTNDIMVDWACNKIKRLNLEEEAVAPYRMGKIKLATTLIDHEPRALDQVPLLLNMNEPQLALIKAIESANTDLIYYVLFMLKQKYSLGDFLLYISDKPVASDLLVCYAREQDPQLLESFFFQADQRSELVNLYARAAFQSSCIEEQARLLHLQQQFQDKYKRPFVGLSVSETLKQCILAGDHSQANKIKTDFKILVVKDQALAELRDWEGLEQFSKSKKSPIGYLPFVQLCIAAPQYAEAAKYIERCDAGIRPGLYVRIKWFDEAAKHAFANKDVAALEEIRGLCNSQQLGQEIGGYISQLSK
ncbi:Vps16, N-terminal region-domain-containing protein [Syncephalis plumigaleata]|nr:Vps16, N-terminal region-domain-containing protein [Syncephalis plumigaleata]